MSDKLEDRLTTELVENTDNFKIYKIVEPLSRMDPRFLTMDVHAYLVFGKDRVMMIDTGTGIYDINKRVKKILDYHGKNMSDLIVICTHNHFDHAGGAYLFENVYIHEDAYPDSEYSDLSWLKGSPGPDMHLVEKRDFKILNNKSMTKLKGGEIFDLGGISFEIQHNPGHSDGCISLISDKSHIFTGDALHLGIIYLLPKNRIPQYLSTLKILKDKVEENSLSVYPGHSDRPLSEISHKTIESVIDGIKSIDLENPDGEISEYLQAHFVKRGKFTFVYPKPRQ